MQEKFEDTRWVIREGHPPQ